jgi:hypothetical protein
MGEIIQGVSSLRFIYGNMTKVRKYLKAFEKVSLLL